MSVLYKHIIQVENRNVGLKVWGGGGGGTNIPLPPYQKSGGAHAPLAPPLPTPVIYIYIYIHTHTQGELLPIGPRTNSTSLGARKEGNVLFNDALHTFYFTVIWRSDSEGGNPLPPHGLLFSINSKGSFICTIPQTG